MTERINAIIKTFLRDKNMKVCVESLEKFYPGVQIVLVDDGYLTQEKRDYYADMRRRGHLVEDSTLPFDSGYGGKSNLAAALCTREFILCCNDDFKFGDYDNGVMGMVDVLDTWRSIGIACGRIGQVDYQGYLERGPGYIREVPLAPNHRLKGRGGTEFAYAGICSVYGLLRREAFQRGLRWDARYKIGGEHADLFIDIDSMGYGIAYVPSANVDTVDLPTHPDYGKFRHRDDWRVHARAKHGPIKFIDFGGSVEQY